MKKPKIKNHGDFWIVYTDKRKPFKCFSLEAALLWRDVLGRREKRCI